jgi:hypothetical protein
MCVKVLMAPSHECQRYVRSPSVGPLSTLLCLSTFLCAFAHTARTTHAHRYSQRVRQEVYRLHRHASGVVFPDGGWALGDLRNATFCLCPSGWGFGWRVYLALVALCIPVIIQPMIEQAFHDLLPYDGLALHYRLADVRRLPDLLRAVPSSRVCALRAAAAKYYRTVMWQQPDGLAYEMTLLSLCRRAVALHRRLSPGKALPAWARCEQLSAEQLLGIAVSNATAAATPAKALNPHSR